MIWIAGAPRPARAAGSHPAGGSLLHPLHGDADEWAKVKKKEHLLEK
jgi:hypothetical protein